MKRTSLERKNDSLLKVRLVDAWPTHPEQYALVAILFIPAYLALEWVTRVHEFGALGIELWNPVKALSFGLLLLKGFSYVPLLFVTAILADIIVYGGAKSVASTLTTGLVVTAGYATVAALLRRGLGFSMLAPTLRNIISFLTVVPVGAFLISCLYCACLLLFGELSIEQYWTAVSHLWVGDTVGIVILLPVAMAAPGIFTWFSDTKPSVLLIDASVFLVGTAIALRLIFFSDWANDFHFFYLLFLPVIWLAIRRGFAGAAVGVCIVHLLLLGLIAWSEYPARTFMSFQLLVLSLSAAGLLLGAVVDERLRSDRLLREQHAEVARMARHATAGAMGVSLAHQISQPLSTVATYIHVGRHMLATKPNEVKPALDALDKAASQLRLAKDILERLRDFVSRGTVRPVPTDLVALTRKVVELAKDDARGHGVTVRFDAGAIRPITVDSLQLEQTLINIINNAIDAASESGRTGGIVTVRILESNSTVRIEVEDNGLGVATDVASHIFEPFVTTKPRGMGLGLALSRELVIAHGGSISWEPIAPNGTRFLIELPIDREVDHD